MQIDFHLLPTGSPKLFKAASNPEEKDQEE